MYMSNGFKTPCELNSIESANYSGPNPTRTWSRLDTMCNIKTYTNTELNLSLIHISEPTRPY